MPVKCSTGKSFEVTTKNYLLSEILLIKNSYKPTTRDLTLLEVNLEKLTNKQKNDKVVST